MPKMYEAVSQYLAIPIGMGIYYSWVYKNYWKPLLQKRKSTYVGEIGSTDQDDPFTQEEKIGYISKGKEPEKGKERKQAEELQREREREGSREQDERDYQEYRDYQIDRLSGYDQYG
jgi:hypothetical protein